jgi:phosphoglycerate dehydrogenase-like enzyme
MAELLAALGEADAVIGQTFTPEMAAAAPRLKLIQAPGAGTDSIDRASLRAGCAIANCYEHEAAIAEFIFGCAFAATRDLLRLDRNLRAEGDFTPSGFYGGAPARELRGSTMGIVGYGRIGRATARLARAYGLRVVAVKAHPEPALAEADGLAWLGGVDRLPALLAEAHYVVVCAPLNEATRGLIGPTEFAAMRSDAYLINVARGPVVDERALYEALRDRRIAGAAIDVWYNYPPGGRGRPGNYPFEELDNLLMTPHVAGWTEGTVSRRVERMAENLRRVAAGSPAESVVYAAPPRDAG